VAADRRLIVTGDDFGLSPGVNAGIVKAYRDGILTSASLMVSAPASEEAVALAHEHPGLAVGLHLVLARGRATAPPESVPDLAGADGRLGDSPLVSGLRYFLLPAVRTQLRREIEAQLRRFQSFELGLSHVDGHFNMHLHPEVLDILLELAWEYRITAIRLTREPFIPALLLAPRWSLRKTAEAALLRALAYWAEPRLRAARIGYADAVHGLYQRGAIDEAYLTGLFGRLPAGSAELCCHPGTSPDPDAERHASGYRHAQELAALCSQRVRASLYEHGITLSNYWQLGEG
jgi:hopanoid biosynthesis associated protein HpnK